jgi:hypothetical protein
LYNFLQIFFDFQVDIISFFCFISYWVVLHHLIWLASLVASI